MFVNRRINGSPRFTRWAFASFLCLLCVAGAAAQDTFSKTKVMRLLKEQGFTGVLSGKITLSYLGNLNCNSAKYFVYNYEWEGPHRGQNAVHFIDRLILISTNGEYAGHYVVEDPPTSVGPSTIRFNYSNDAGNEIACDAKGLPKTVILDGSQSDLEK
jgi:hypothetical protein